MSFSLDMADDPCPRCHRGGHVWEWDGMTYNLAPMFRKAGFYEAIEGPFRDFCDAMRNRKPEDPEPINRGVAVEDVVELVRKGRDDMVENEDDYRELSPENGWGDYPGALRFTRALLKACVDHPHATIKFSG